MKYHLLGRAILAACIAVLASVMPAAAETNQSSSAEQLWRSKGYGFGLRISGDSLEILQIVEGYCVKAAQATRSAAESELGTLYEIDAEQSEPVLDVDSGRIFLHQSASDELRLVVEGAVSNIVFNRVAVLPAACDKKPENSPHAVLDVVAQTYREHYPFFDLHPKVNWERAVRAAHQKLPPNATDKDLFEAIRGLIAPLQDAHTGITTVDGGPEFFGDRADPQPLTDRDFEKVRHIIQGYLTAPLKKFANGEIEVGTLPGRVAYLRVASFSDYVDSSRIDDAIAEVDRALDRALTGKISGVVVDVRVNGGGSDVLGNRIIAHLTDDRYPAYAKVAKDTESANGFTAAQDVFVEPFPGSRFTGPVAVLTSRYSVSAAETFAQATLGRRPAVARIGEHTQGVFSDVLIRLLPNGWLFGLPNEVYLTDGKSFDVTGVPPTIETGLVFRRSNLNAGRDPEIERALAFIKDSHHDAHHCRNAAAWPRTQPQPAHGPSPRSIACWLNCLIALGRQ